MEDPWGNNDWSSADSEKHGDISKEFFERPKWNNFERDRDEDTVDVGIPSWSAPSDSGWRDGTNLWHAESSALDVWKPSLNIDELREELDEEPDEEEDVKKQEEDNGSPKVRAVLPTPPLSPLPLPSTTTPSVETPQSSPPMPLINPPSPDHFGSFESAEVVSKVPYDNSSWTPKAPHILLEATNEPWEAAWSGGEAGDHKVDQGEDDEWELAQEMRRKRDRKVPPELLDSLVQQWEEFSTNIYPTSSTEGSDHTSWRKGLDSVDGLSELVDSILPVISFPPPTPFNKTAVAKSVKEALRHTRSFPLTQSSPMAHLYASKGSTDWERSVKAQKAVANDEWGWDLKHESEEKPVTDSGRDKKSSGLLSFWSRKTISMPGTTVGNPVTMNSTIPPAAMSKPTSPSMSARPSVDTSHVASPTITTSPSLPLPPNDMDTESAHVPSTQPSAVSRFLNRFSRKPTAIPALTPGQEKRMTLSLSSDDLSFLSDMTPSTTEGSLQSPSESASINSMGAMLSWPTKNSSPSSSKLPPPIAPPPSHSPHPAGHNFANSLGSDKSFDAEMEDAQFMDLLDKAIGGGPSSGSGYAPVTINLLESPEDTNIPLPALQAADPGIHPPPMSLASRLQPPVISPNSITKARTPFSSLPMDRDAPSVAPDPVPLIPPPRNQDGSSKHAQPVALARFHNPLPPTPKRGLVDLEDFSITSPVSGQSTPPHSSLLPQFDSYPSIKASTTTSLLPSISNHPNSLPASNENDSFDFGDFISTPIRTPSPPKVPQKTFNTAIHKPTLGLVEKGAARQGRWPAPPSPIPLPLAPPPGPSSKLGYFDISPMPQQPSQLDLLTDDVPPINASVSGAVLGQGAAVPLPLFTHPPSSPISMDFGVAPAPLPALSISRTPSPSVTPKFVSSKPAGGSGLSAQDLSFFEGL